MFVLEGCLYWRDVCLTTVCGPIDNGRTGDLPFRLFISSMLSTGWPTDQLLWKAHNCEMTNASSVQVISSDRVLHVANCCAKGQHIPVIIYSIFDDDTGINMAMLLT